ncbi:CPBP family intramembrane glutamic endopeptidase [Polluticaenibacter yanchengensis]|uniref:Type II CAAX endopeptidase family protein n=1 Tax=Polluticaenibacter yanchengensis TaxID=3014562 RepID=A0ABT4UHJ6_9BACT|nr:type II CAAX endopeptidase family protein [Chitinophagaceae bacterium LY-5]
MLETNKEFKAIPFGWMRAIMLLVTYVLLLFVLNALFGKLILRNAENDYLLLGYNVGCSLVAAVISVLVFTKFADKQPLRVLGLSVERHNTVINSLTGMAAALFVLACGSFILLIFGHLKILERDWLPVPLVIYLFIMLGVALAEELVFRGYILRNLMGSFNPVIALLISSLLFAGLHVMNNHFNVMAFLGIFSAGMVIGVNYIFTKNIWYAVVFHWLWNFFQGPILGYPVSGIAINSQFIQDLQGPDWLTGGAFGYEASVFVILLNTAIFLFLYKQYSTKFKVSHLPNF